MIGKLPTEATLLPVQALGELFHVLVRKAGRSPERARTAILSWQDTFPLIETSPAVLLAGLGVGSEASFRNLGRDNRRGSGGRGLPVASLRRHAVRFYVERRDRNQSIFARPS